MVGTDFINSLGKIYKKYDELFIILMLFIVFYFVFFHNIGTYPLMDVDETRYVAMSRDMFLSKDFSTLYLNGEYFFEKPPLYFWQECLSFWLFGGQINEFSARFPVAFLGFSFCFVVYFMVKHWINRKFGIFASLVLATSLEFLIISKYAILDIVLTFYIGLALICYFSTYFCKNNHEKYFWWCFYIFSGLAVMAKGVPGIVIPFGIVFFASIYSGKFKEIFKPVNIIPGFILFLLIVLPWHIYMLQKHGDLFFNEYIVKHHLHRFLNTPHNEIGRKQPFYFYFIVLLWGFMPWILSVIGVTIEKLVYLFKNHKFFVKFEELDNTYKLISLCLISVFWTFLFFSSSSTKLATYIMPVYFPLAIITGLVWKNYVEKEKYEKTINLTVNIFGWLCLILGICAIFTPLFLPKWLNDYIFEVRIFSILCFIIFGAGTLLCVKYKKYLGVFILYVCFITVISGFGTGNFFNIDYKFGQIELVEFAKYAKAHNYTISANGLSRKYSLLFYNDKRVDYNPDDANIESILEDLQQKNNIVIIKNKFFDEIDNSLDFEVIKKGKKYSMIKGLNK